MYEVVTGNFVEPPTQSNEKLWAFVTRDQSILEHMVIVI